MVAATRATDRRLVTATLESPPAVGGAEPRATYGGLLRHREFAIVFAAHVVSMLGSVVSQVALTVLVYARTGSPALSALTFSVGFLPYLFGGALFSGLVDRWPARRTMITCDLAAMTVFAIMALPGLPLGGLLGLAFVGGLIAPIFGGTRAALLPALLGSGPSYVLGRSMMRMVAQSAQVIGYALGGLLLAFVGPRTALLIDAGSFLVSAVTLRIGLRPHPAVGTQAPSLVRDSLRGLRAVLGDGPTRRQLMMRWLVPTCVVAPEALAAAYVHGLQRGQAATGLYLAMMPVGTVVADLVCGRWLSPLWQRRLIVPGALLATAPMLLFLASPGYAFTLVLLVVLGLGSCYALALDGLLLHVVPRELRSRALAVDQAGLMFLQGAGFGVWGALGQVVPLRVTIALAGAVGVAVVVVWRRKSRWRWGG
jgi:MFS family permease